MALRLERSMWLWVTGSSSYRQEGPQDPEVTLRLKQEGLVLKGGVGADGGRYKWGGGDDGVCVLGG